MEEPGPSPQSFATWTNTSTKSERWRQNTPKAKSHPSVGLVRKLLLCLVVRRDGGCWHLSVITDILKPQRSSHGAVVYASCPTFFLCSWKSCDVCQVSEHLASQKFTFSSGSSIMHSVRKMLLTLAAQNSNVIQQTYIVTKALAALMILLLAKRLHHNFFAG